MASVPGVSSDPLSYGGLDPYVNPQFTNARRAPTIFDQKNPGSLWQDSSQNPPNQFITTGAGRWEEINGGGGGGIQDIVTNDGMVVTPFGGNIYLYGDGTFLTTRGVNPGGQVFISPKFNFLGLIQTDSGHATPDGTGLLNMHGVYHSPHGVPLQVTGNSLQDVDVVVQLSSSGGISDAATAGVASFNSANFNVDANGYVSLIGSEGSSEITPYVVGVLANGAAFTTIQSALAAAHSISPNGAQIYIQPKADGSTWAESLTLYANQTICSFDSNNIVSITGNHTPPASGTVSFQGILLITTSGSIINCSALTTSAGLLFDNCRFNITSGYIVFASGVGMTGSLALFNCVDNSTANGIINASAASLYMSDSRVGAGATNALMSSLTSYDSYLANTGTVTLSSSVSYFWETNFNGTLTLNNSAHVFGFNSVFITSFNNSNACVNIGASAEAGFWDCSFNSSATYSLTGSGTLSVQNCNMGPADPINPALTTTVNGATYINTLNATELVTVGIPGTTAVGDISASTNYTLIDAQTSDTGIILGGNGEFATATANGVGIKNGSGFMLGDGTLITMSPNTSPYLAGTYSAGQFTLVSGTVDVSTNIFNGEDASNCFVFPSVCYNAANQGFLKVTINPASGFTVDSTSGTDGSSYGWYAMVLANFTPMLDAPPEMMEMESVARAAAPRSSTTVTPSVAAKVFVKTVKSSLGSIVSKKIVPFMRGIKQRLFYKPVTTLSKILVFLNIG